MKEESNHTNITIVGVGASAGGLEALQEFISHLPADLKQLAIVIAQHLSPTHKSMLVQLLSRQTSLEVVEIQHKMAVQKNKVYITPPDSELTIVNNYFVLAKPKSAPGPKPSVDVFFKSLAKAKGASAIGIILSGTGSDGAQGIKSIKEANGVTIVQEPQTAKYNGMPISAIETGYVDMVLSPDKMGGELQEIISYPSLKKQNNPEENDASDKTLKRLFHLLSDHSGTDFSNYKPSTIYRRLEKRIVELKLKDAAHYLEYIEQEPAELEQLFNKILIGVTSFFRDPELFNELEKRLKNIVANKKPNDSIRIWVPGCATGEEAYSIALLLIRILKNKAPNYDIQIFATDIDGRAINHARAGIYPKKSLEYVPEDILNNYILKKNDDFEILKSVRQMILFSKHDVTSNPPFLKLDLISCRNLLIYFGQSLQQHVIPVFHYALNPNGYLFLGKSETVGQFTDLFNTEDGKSKIFRRRPDSNSRNIRFSTFKPKRLADEMGSKPVKTPKQITIPEMVKETLYSSFAHAYVVTDSNMFILEVSGDVRMFLNINPGAMNTNIIKMAHKSLQIGLRSMLMKATKEGKAQQGQVKRIVYFDTQVFVRLAVQPLILGSKSQEKYYCVIFETFDFEETLLNVTSPDKEDSGENPRILELEQELSSTKEHLQTFVEELETANEELQSLNEELQSSNEELQSSNEELETSNEELQSTNEELQIAYGELKVASKQIELQSRKLKDSEANAQALLNNTLQAFMLISQDYRLISFNKTAEIYMEEVFAKKPKIGDTIIDFQLEGTIEQFHRDFNKAIKGENIFGEKELEVSTEDFRWYRYHYTPVKNDKNQIEVVSYSQLDITDQKLVEISLAENERLISSIFNAVDVGICVTNEAGCFTKVNQVYCEIYGYTAKELIGQSFAMVLPQDQRDRAQEMHRRYLDGHPESAGTWKVQTKSGEIIEVRVTTARLISERGKRFKVTSVSPIRF